MIKFFEFFLRKRQFTYLLLLAITGLGLTAAVLIPKESAPEVKIPVGIVMTILPGSNAQDVEKLVTNKIEDGLNNLTDLNKITSISREGASIVTVEFTAQADLEKSLRNLKDEVDKIKNELPAEANEPTVLEINFADQPMFIASIASDLPASEFSSLAKKVRDELKAMPGVSKAEISGARNKEIQIILNQSRLQNYGLRLGEIVAAIAGSNVSMPIGNITTNNIDYALKFEGEIANPSTIGDIAITNKNGEPIYLRDLGTIAEGVEMASSLSRFSQNGTPAKQSIAISIYKKSGESITQVSSSIKKRLTEMQKSGILKGAEILYSFDSSKQVKDDLLKLVRSGLETIFLVVIILFLTLGWREALVAALSIPLSFLISFIGLYYSGNTINFISLFSLILAVGILVDSGIVVVESIHTRWTENKTGQQAAHETLQEYGWPLIAGTMTSIAVFVPLFFLSGITGKFIASIPFTLIAVLLASIFVALALIPLIATKTFKRSSINHLVEKQETYTRLFQEWYRRQMGKILDNNQFQKRFLWGIGLAFFVSLLFPVVGLVKVVFFSQADADFIYIDIEKNQGTPLMETDLATRTIEEMLYENRQIESFITTIGSGSNFSGTGDNQSGSRYANITINLKKNRTQTSTEIVEGLREKTANITNATVRVLQPNNGPPTGAPVEIKFAGEDLGLLNQIAAKAENILKNIPGTREVDSSTKDDLPDFVLTLDQAKASLFGLNSASIAQTLRGSVYGLKASSLRIQDEDIDINLKTALNPNYLTLEDITKTNLDSIKQIPIITPRGTILLGSVVDISIKKSNSTIEHENRERIVKVTSQVDERTTSGEIIKKFQSEIAKEKLPDGVRLLVGGENEDINKTFSEMFIALIIGLLLIFAILILEFNSIRYALYLIIIVPLSLIGVFTGLAISRQALSFPSLLGFIALTGIIINHIIILIDSMNLARRRYPERPMKELVIEASVVRLRPILLTTITTVIGMVPLSYAGDIWGPLAYAIMFGLAFAVILTLILVPILYYRWPGELPE